MDIPKLKAAKDVEPDMSLAAYFSGLPRHKMDVGLELSDIITTVFHRSIEAAWPSMLTLGRRMQAGWTASAAGWTFRTVDTGNPWHVAFAAGKAGTDSGFLFTCVLEKERSAAFKEARAARSSGIMKNLDVAERRKLLATEIIGEIMEEEKALAFDPGLFRDPAEVEAVDQVKIHVFRGTDKPDFYDGNADRIEDLLPLVRDDSYSSGLVATCTPTDDRLDSEPSASASDRCSETATTLAALRVLETGLEQAGLLKAVYERSELVSSRRYLHFGDELSVHLAEAAQMAVYADSGFAGPHSFETVWEFWKDAAGFDLTRIAGKISETAAALVASGHGSREAGYECNDGRDHVFATARPSFTLLWLTTQGGKYGILVNRGPDGEPSHFSLSRIKDFFGKSAAAIDPEGAGFLGSFEAVLPGDDGLTRFGAVKMGRMTDRAIRDLNNILISLDSVHTCLKEDTRATARP